MVDGCKKKNTMKKFISNLIFATFVALGLASCSKTDKNLEKLSGEWYWQGTEAGVELEVYVAFEKDNTFDLFQKIGDGAYRVYSGTYTLTPGADGLYILSGEYSDGTPWGAEYAVLSSSNDTMVLTAGDVTETYTRVTGGIPEDVKNSAAPVKSAGDAGKTTEGAEGLRFL